MHVTILLQCCMQYSARDLPRLNAPRDLSRMALEDVSMQFKNINVHILYCIIA